MDKDNILVAGHTRLEAAKQLGLKEIPCIRAVALDEQQIQSFRIIDNKTAELATWDMNDLADEINDLVESGIDFVQYGWSQEEIDCLADIVEDDCLSDEELTGVNAAHKAQKEDHISVDPKSVKVAIGEINFFVDIADYQEWSHEIRKKNKFDQQSIIDDLAKRLGMKARKLKKKKTEAPKKEEPKKPARKRKKK